MLLKGQATAFGGCYQPSEARVAVSGLLTVGARHRNNMPPGRSLSDCSYVPFPGRVKTETRTHRSPVALQWLSRDCRTRPSAQNVPCRRDGSRRPFCPESRFCPDAAHRRYAGAEDRGTRRASEKGQTHVRLFHTSENARAVNCATPDKTTAVARPGAFPLRVPESLRKYRRLFTRAPTKRVSKSPEIFP